jgi:hypothetical protein
MLIEVHFFYNIYCFVTIINNLISGSVETMRNSTWVSKIVYPQTIKSVQIHNDRVNTDDSDIITYDDIIIILLDFYEKNN